MIKDTFHLPRQYLPFCEKASIYAGLWTLGTDFNMNLT